MNSFESMKAALSPIGIYNITEKSNIAAELRVYASELDRLYEEAEEILRESFYPTAEDWGLSRSERLWGKVRDDLPTDIRRQMLLKRSSIGYGDFTPTGIEKLLAALDAEGEVEEFPSGFRLTVNLQHRNYTQPQQKWIKSQFDMLFPAHLEVEPVFSGFNWAYADSRGLSFSQIEAKGMSWAEIDSYCIP